jgi:hypothetical protein
LFDEFGRRLPGEDMRVFSRVPRSYYRLNQPRFRYEDILGRVREHVGDVPLFGAGEFEAACAKLRSDVEAIPALAGLFNGVHVPFALPAAEEEVDLGANLEEYWLPAVGRSFMAAYPKHHFRVTVQGEPTLKGSLRVAENTRYEKFLEARRRGPVAGWYFPGALQEYDVASQRAQVASLPLPDSLVLSGGFDASAALIGSPELLVNEEAYPPVLCLSALRHRDERLMLCFKAYGLSLEFWCMSQMLTPTMTQVSEQWAGGLTLFAGVQ